MASQQHPELRHKRRAPKVQPIEVRLTYPDASGAPRVVPAHVVDVTETGLGLQLRSALPEGAVISFAAGNPAAASSDIHLQSLASVRWCRALAGGLYRAGVLFQSKPAAAPSAAPFEDDYYELLQVNPKASADTIHRVYRILAQQYHPDNHETGDESAFRNLTTAYKVLSDPERRAAYDLSYEAVHRSRWQIFNSPQSVQGIEAERRKRFGILRALYAKRVQDSREPSMSLPELESLLGVPRDHLEFTLWYLKERNYITRTDNIRYLITAAGVEHTEALEESFTKDQPLPTHLLPAPVRRSA